MPGKCSDLLKYFFLFCCSVGWHFTSFAQPIYVSPSGSDAGDGSMAQPFATLNMALRKAREQRRVNDPAIAAGIHIILKGGRYALSEPVFIRPEDAGSTESPTMIEAAAGEHPVLSGGVELRNWKRLTNPVPGISAIANGKLWVADVPLMGGQLFNFRQLWVNGQKAVRAKSTPGATMERIISWNKLDETCIIPTPNFSGLKHWDGVEFFIHQWWAIAILRVKKAEVMGDSTRLFFHQPESRIQSEHPWPAPWISKETGNSAFYFTNALAFLDEPGEWWLDVVNRKIYYWPRQGENLASANMIAPYLETLVKVNGTMDHPVSHITFKGISFQHAGWLRPSQQGHVPHQNGLYMTDAYKLKPAGTKDKASLENQAWIGRPAAAVEVNYADRVHFTACRFEHLASTGLDFHKAIHQNEAKGNLFKDIGGSGLLAGVFSDEATEIHLPYNPKDEREVCDGMVISNNLVTDVTNEDWSCVGIGIGYARNTMVEHNEVENVGYSGITMGWGWSPAPNAMRDNTIRRNKVHHYGKHNYDCAGIYTLSAQPGSVIAENEIDSIFKAPYSHLPSHWFYLYTDEGSSYFTIKDNWTPTAKFLQNANGPGNQWINNGPQVAATIRANAGLQDDFKYLGTERTAAKLLLPTNREHYEVIELVVKEGQTLDLAKLKALLSNNNMDSNAIYQWKNHFVIYDKVKDIGVMEGRIRNHFPQASVRVYHDLFYEYSKRRNCADTNTAKEWDHVLLTANLVADEKLQREYLDYHATQFEQWPEVAHGFCNAGFQELLLFRNGRRLMLIISIPKGESLDKLNPRTTAGNPRVDEWNKIMGKYQEGIEGTKPGEKWVFLKKL